MSDADLWVFAGVVAVEHMTGGELKIGFREGRVDKAAGPSWTSAEAPDGEGEYNLRVIIVPTWYSDDHRLSF
jgi:catalase (peroxidase I)